MQLHKIVNHCKRAHELGLGLEIVLLGNCQNLETLLHYTKDPLDHITELYVPVVKQFLVCLWPEGDGSECI